MRRRSWRPEPADKLRRQFSSQSVRCTIDVLVGIELVHREADAVEPELWMGRTNRHLVPLEKRLHNGSAVESFRQ